MGFWDKCEATLRARRPFLVVAFAIVLGFGYFTALKVPYIQRERSLRRADPQSLLAACRELIVQREDYKVASRFPDSIFLDLSDSVTPELPTAIRELKPHYVSIDDKSVLVRISARMALRGYASGVEESGDEKIIDGLWIVRSGR